MPEFTNPNQAGSGSGGGQDNRSLVLMMIIMVGVFFGLQYFRQKPAPPVAPQPSSQTAPAVPSPNQPTAANPAAMQAPTPANAVASGPAISSGPAVQALAESSTVVENELYKITFSNRGAQVTSWLMKTQKDSNGKPLDLVHRQAAQDFGHPLSLFTYDPAVTSAVNSAMYLPSATGLLPAPATLSFHYAANGLDVTKTFTFDETYLIHADILATKGGVPVRALLSWPGGFGDEDSQLAYASAQLDTMRNTRGNEDSSFLGHFFDLFKSGTGTEDHLAPKKISNGDTLNGPFEWAGVSDMYFAAIFLPDSPSTATLATLSNQIDVAKTIHQAGFRALTSSSDKPVMVPILGAALGDLSGHTLTRIYAGPKLVNVLRNVHVTDSKETLAPLLDFGFFGPIGKYLFLALQWIHSTVTLNWSGSWGWAIVFLTVIINLLILPLRVKTMQSGLKMQRIAPQMDAIKARYAKYKVTDPKRNDMNAEIMKLQKDNGVNMFGGCIPTLIQMPLLFAFFGMLPKVVELRNAHWLWLPDLTQADPHHILPIVMMASQFLVQFYTPSPGVDPQQQKMMAFMMPAVSGYMTWNYASGLALYWSVGNLIGIAQQAVMNRTSLGREMREIAAKRARRKSGNGAAAGKIIPGRR